MREWKQCKKLLCIRADNMGDVIMSGPAISALKKNDCSVTLLTSALGSLITPFMPCIDETIVSNLPWVKANDTINASQCERLIPLLRSCMFDAVVIFTVYSQSSLPAALMTYIAGIPLRLAYCRENPYSLLSHWLPDKEPYSFIQHQVQRDLNLVKHIGADTDDDRLQLIIPGDARKKIFEKLTAIGVDLHKKYIIAHPGVSEDKRMYPVEMWIASLKKIYEQVRLPIIITGTENEAAIALRIKNGSGNYIYVACGMADVAEFIAMIDAAALVISVNTSTVHIASAVQTPVVVLYAQTNPQHTPWKNKHVVLPFSVPRHLQSSNEVIQYVNNNLYKQHVAYPTPEEVADAALTLLSKQQEAVEKG